MSTRQIGRMATLIFLSFFLIVNVSMAAETAAPKAKATPKTNLFNELVNKAKEEMARLGGKFFIKTELEDGIKFVAEEFKKEFPFIKEINHERQNQAEQQLTFLMELKAGKDVRADVRQISRDALVEYRAAGMVEKPPFPWKQIAEFLPKDWGKIDSARFDPEGFYLVTSIRTHGIAYNHTIIPKEKWPKSWNDCVDPYFKGKVIYDPRTAMGGFLHDPKLRDWHIDWLKKLVKNNVVFNRGQSSSLEKVAAGEYAIFPACNFYSYQPLLEKIGTGAPISFTFGEYVHVELGTEMFFVKGATKAPATGQLFALWLASKGVGPIDEYVYRGWPLDPRTHAYELAKGKYLAICGADCFAKAQEYSSLLNQILEIPGAK